MALLAQSKNVKKMKFVFGGFNLLFLCFIFFRTILCVLCLY